MNSVSARSGASCPMTVRPWSTSWSSATTATTRSSTPFWKPTCEAARDVTSRDVEENKNESQHRARRTRRHHLDLEVGKSQGSGEQVHQGGDDPRQRTADR